MSATPLCSSTESLVAQWCMKASLEAHVQNNDVQMVLLYMEAGVKVDTICTSCGKKKLENQNENEE